MELWAGRALQLMALKPHKRLYLLLYEFREAHQN
jgi:hypothetical protein